MKALNFQKRYELLLLIATTHLPHMEIMLQFLNVPMRLVPEKILYILQRTVGLGDGYFNVWNFISKLLPSRKSLGHDFEKVSWSYLISFYATIFYFDGSLGAHTYKVPRLYKTARVRRNSKECTDE